jgi:hypothetical protein
MHQAPAMARAVPATFGVVYAGFQAIFAAFGESR